MSSSSTSGNSNDAQQQCNNRVGRGRELLAFMSTQTLVSDWDGDPIKTFEKYGYIPKRQSDVLPDNPERERVYTELGISLSTNRWATMQVDHLNKYTISFQDKVTKKMKTETYNVCRIQILGSNTFANNAIKLADRYMVQDPDECASWISDGNELTGHGYESKIMGR